ncbi:hypothetical protein VZG28_01790 [Synechococcus elongatus IITB4]|uniref:hypothetical protein n=1 Tax=Synechococcus elongatus TaxID=32046 RepID=UPI0030D08752
MTVLAAPPDASLDLELPDPSDEALTEGDFQQQVDQAWLVCDRFDLQTEIWRGRILRVVRDREKRGGEGRGMGFLNWLKDREITKSRAYALIELANSADALVDEGILETDTLSRFSKRAFVETSQSAPEVQQLIGDAARNGQRITRQQVRQLTDEWTAVSSDLLPEPVRLKAAENRLPAKAIAPFVRELEKLPEIHQAPLQEEVALQPDLNTLKEMTAAARYLSRYLEAAQQVRTLNNTTLDLEQALNEAQRLDILNLVSDLLSQSAQLEQAIAKLYTSWRRVSSLSDRLYVESGASTPNLRSLLQHLQTLSGTLISLPLGDIQSGRVIQLQVVDDGEPA